MEFSPNNEIGGIVPLLDAVMGASKVIRAMRAMIRTVARMQRPVLLLGEVGTGKNMVARLVHYYSQWRAGPFAQVRCAGSSSARFETELMAQFAGADKTTLVFGTVFLSNISELDEDGQKRLVELLTPNGVLRLETPTIAVLRLVGSVSGEAGNIGRSLLIPALGEFFAGSEVVVPPLRKHIEDLPAIAEYLARRYANQYQLPFRPLSSRLIQMLMEHTWPGNLLELSGIMRLYVALGEADVIDQLKRADGLARQNDRNDFVA